MGMSVASINAGIGGLELGFKEVGFNIEWAIERDLNHCKTLRKLLYTDVLNDDIKNIKIEDIPNVDVIILKYFAYFSYVVKRNEHMERSDEDSWFVEAISRKEPKVFIIHTLKLDLIQNLIRELDSRGEYDIRYEQLNTNEYGIPYKQKIGVCVGVKKELRNAFKFEYLLKEEQKDFNNELKKITFMNKEESVIFKRDRLRCKNETKFIDKRSPIRYMGIPTNPFLEMENNQCFSISTKEALILKTFPRDFEFELFRNKPSRIKAILNTFPYQLSISIATIIKDILQQKDIEMQTLQCEIEDNDCLDEAKENSLTKVDIVVKCFKAWINRRKNEYGLTYIDLYSGPGIFKDGMDSTPLRIIKHCISDKIIKKEIKFIFNDESKERYVELRTNIDNISGLEELTHKPRVFNKTVDSALGDILKDKNLKRIFSFIDPYGYKGLTKKLIDSLTESWSSDCLFFFNYNRINAGLCNRKVRDSINNVFGEECANSIREKIDAVYTSDLSSSERAAERETIIIDEFCNIFSKEGTYVLPFRFEKEHLRKTSHYLIFVSKNYISYKIIKDIMCKASSEKIDGIGSFSYIVNKNIKYKNGYVYKHSFSRLEDLKNMLMDLVPRGKSFQAEEICRKYNIGTPFTEANIKEVLRELEKDGKITVIPSNNQRRKDTMSDKNKIIFKSN